MSRQAMIARVEEVCERVGQTEGIEIVEVELKGSGRNQVLRIFIDKPEGVTHGDCESVSRKVGEILETEDTLADPYVLEVSSPGVERKLKKPRDFQRFQGKKIRVVMRESNLADRKSKLVEGVIAAAEEDGILLDTPGGERMHISFADMDRANLKFEW